MIMSALALLKACPDPGDQHIVAAMQGNICRCGTYRRITRAVRQAAEVLLAWPSEPAEATEGVQEAQAAEKSGKAAV
jgi:xanthine dehydrogenase iron-sulfur cluster and FAD-binding subunit A